MNLKSKDIYRNQKMVYGIGFLTLLLSFYSSNQWSDFPIGNDFFWWVVQIIFIIILLKLKRSYTSPLVAKNLLFVKLYLYWNVICFVRGGFVAENYWEFKFLIAHSLFLLLPLLVYTATNSQSIQSIVKTWFRYSLFLYILFIPFIWGDGVGKFLIPFSFLLLFFPFLNSKWKIIALFVTIYVIAFDITSRSNVLKFLIPLLIMLLFYFRKLLSVKVLNISRLSLLFSPVLFLYLAVTTNFNVFKMDEYFGEQNTETKARTGEIREESLTADTRTPLYIEVIESALRNNYVFFGRTPARGNDSVIFGEFTKLELNTGKQERFDNEASIMNIFTWLGLVGVVLYFLIFMKASYLAINQSSNIFIKLIGLNVAFRWTYGWVEDFSVFDLSNIFLWIMIGMCFSATFRKMTDQEVKMWVRGIFEKKALSRKVIYPSSNFQQKLL